MSETPRACNAGRLPPVLPDRTAGSKLQRVLSVLRLSVA